MSEKDHGTEHEKHRKQLRNQADDSAVYSDAAAYRGDLHKAASTGDNTINTTASVIEKMIKGVSTKV